MQINRILSLVPPKYKRRLYVITALNVLRSVLDLIGLASLLPIVMIILDQSVLEGDSVLGRLFRGLNLESVMEFGVVISVCVLLWLPLKSALSIWINKTKQSYLLELYRHYSNERFSLYHRRGLLYIKGTHTSQLAIYINGACYGFSVSVVGGVISLAAELFLIVLLGASALYASPLASLLLGVSLVPMLAVYFFVAKNKIKELGVEGYEMRRKQAMIVQDSLRGFASMTVNGSQELVFEEFNQGLNDISRNDINYSIYSQIPSLLMQMCVAVALIIIMFWGGGGAASSASIFVIFGFIASRLMPSLLRISGIWNVLQNTSHLLDEISDTDEAEAEEAEEVKESERPITFNHSIEVRNVSFTFPDGATILKDFSLSIRKGEIIGFAGKSGSGKSTLFNILLGLYKPSEGGVYVDEQLLSPSNRTNWHKLIGYAEQDVFISSDTLAYNIAMAKDADKNRVTAIVEKVGLKEWLETLSDGIDTAMNEQGANVSGGEKQRIGVARVLYRNAQILFFDETTSALDIKNEENILSLLTGIARKNNLTILIISHRDSTLQMCDKVVRM